MAREGVVMTAPAMRRIEPMTIEIPLENPPAKKQPKEKFFERIFNRYCPENMETKTKVYIAILLILPSFIYFLISVNMPSARTYVRKADDLPSLNMTTLKDYDSFDLSTTAESFNTAVENSQAIIPKGVDREALEQLAIEPRQRRNAEIEDPALFLLSNS